MISEFIKSIMTNDEKWKHTRFDPVVDGWWVRPELIMCSATKRLRMLSEELVQTDGNIFQEESTGR